MPYLASLGAHRFKEKPRILIEVRLYCLMRQELILKLFSNSDPISLLLALLVSNSYNQLNPAVAKNTFFWLSAPECVDFA